MLQQFALLGAGEVGTHIAHEFLDTGLALTVFTRNVTGANVSALSQRGARAVVVDYYSQDSLRNAFKDIDVAICTLGGRTALDMERRAALAAKQAGVQVFVANMWGSEYCDPKIQRAPLHPDISDKIAFLEKLQRIELPWLAIANGLLSSWAFTPFFGSDVSAHRASWAGDATQELTMTNPTDIARFLRHVLVTQPLPAPGRGKYYKVEGHRTSFEQIFRIASQLDGEPWDIDSRTIARANSQQTDSSQEGFVAWILSCIDDGRSLLQAPDNDWIGFKPSKSLSQSISEALAKARGV